MDEITFGERFVYYCYDHEHAGNVVEMAECKDCYCYIRRLKFIKNYEMKNTYHVLVEDRGVTGYSEQCSVNEMIPKSSFMM